MNKPKRIIIHHSLTKDSDTVSWGAIRRYHTNVRGWDDIGYHAGIEVVDGAPECFYGRPWTQVGAHTQGQNRNTLGFCFVGNYDIVEPDPIVMAIAVRRVIAPWCLQFEIDPKCIHGHREYATKTCPGAMFDVDTLRNMVWAELEE